MKTERIEFVAPPGFRARLQEEASRTNVSVGELIRQRFEPSTEEQELAQATAELRQATMEARAGLGQALSGMDQLLAELRSRRRRAA